MRIWNGLRINDIVKYNCNKYIITKLYIYENKRVCDLSSLNDYEKNILKEIEVCKCEKII